MKKIISLLVSLTLMLSIIPMTVMADGTGWDGTTTTEITNGTGTSSDPYLISTPEELAWARDLVNTSVTEGDTTTYPNKAKCFKLTADIDLNNKEWTPIGLVANNGFNGTFDGNGYAVKNIRMTVKRTYMGFFGHVESASKIKNLGIENMDVDIVGSGATIGGLFGRGYADEISNCYVKNSSILNNSTAETAGSEANLVNTSGTIGGFIGTLRTTTDPIKNCYVYNVEIGGPCRVSLGGFWGSSENTSDASKVTNCYVAKLTEKTIEGRQTGRIYAFGAKNKSGTNAGTIKTSVTNSWSEFIGRAGTRSDPSYPYEVEYAMGNEGATKEGLITALVTDGGSYIVDADVNDGYPCLDYEKTELVAANAYAGGTGTSTDPYQIATAEQLMYARDMVNKGDHKAKSFVLTADIDLEGSEWEPIGVDATNNFSGTFDGNGKVVSNIKITQTHPYVGFFGHAHTSTIKNLGIDSLNVESSAESANLGGMIGRGGVTVSNCFIRNSSISAPNLRYCNPGMMINSVRTASTFTNCYVYNCTMTAKDCSNLSGFAGGFEGNNSSTFTNCYVANITIGTSNKASVYPFGRNTGSGVQTVENCLSNLMSASGTDSRYPYKADYAFGTYTESKTDITGAFENVEGFKLDSAINDGYPSLSWETVPVVVEPNPYVIAAVNTNGMVKVTILENSAVTGANVYVASYDVDGRLLGADVLPATVGTQTSTVDATGATTIKVFVWNPNQTPIANMYSK